MIGPKASRKLNKDRLNIRLSKESVHFLRQYAHQMDCTISELTEGIICEYRATPENYFIKSAAYFGFINSALVTLIATKLFEPERMPYFPLTAVKEEITKEAAKLFGEQPPTPFPEYTYAGDDRLWSLFNAFAAHHMRREGDLEPIHTVR